VVELVARRGKIVFDTHSVHYKNKQNCPTELVEVPSGYTFHFLFKLFALRQAQRDNYPPFEVNFIYL